MQIISECCTYNPLFGDSSTSDESIIPSAMAGGETTGSLERSDFSLMQSLAAGQKCFVLSDPKLPDNPIVFATSDFYKLTGYTSQEVLGRNCRFLQGPGTDKRAVDVIRKAVATGSDATVCLINYKSDGTPFWNQFFIAALRDSDNNIVNFVCTHILVYVLYFADANLRFFLHFSFASERLAFKLKSNQKLRLFRR
jgi:PAS domain S-box-containing protein